MTPPLLLLACWSLAAACTSLCLFAVLVFAVEAVVELGGAVALAGAALSSSFLSLIVARWVWAANVRSREVVRSHDFRSLFHYAARVAVRRTRSFWVSSRDGGAVSRTSGTSSSRSLTGDRKEREERVKKREEDEDEHRRALLCRSRSFKRILGER